MNVVEKQTNLNINLGQVDFNSAKFVQIIYDLLKSKFDVKNIYRVINLIELNHKHLVYAECYNVKTMLLKVKNIIEFMIEKGNLYLIDAYRRLFEGTHQYNKHLEEFVKTKTNNQTDCKLSDNNQIDCKLSDNNQTDDKETDDKQTDCKDMLTDTEIDYMKAIYITELENKKKKKITQYYSAGNIVRCFHKIKKKWYLANVLAAVKIENKIFYVIKYANTASDITVVPQSKYSIQGFKPCKKHQIIYQSHIREFDEFPVVHNTVQATKLKDDSSEDEE
jgi:hypothetical protein